MAKTSKDLLSPSQILTWLRCKWEWRERYEHRLTPRVERRPPSLGKATHAALAAYLLGQDPVVAVDKWYAEYLMSATLFDEEIEAAQVIREQALHIARRTTDSLPLSDWEVVEYQGAPLVERRFVVPLTATHDMQAIIDWVMLHKPTGMLWLGDWKIRGQFYPEDSEEVNLQMAAYQRIVAHHLGIPVVGSICFQVSNRTPAQPTLNKNGTMSKALIKTDWETYRAALLANNLDPDDYLDMAAKLGEVEWYRPVRAYRSGQEIDAIWKQVVVPAAWEISRKSKHYPRAMGQRTCNGCWARQVCLERMRGGDVDYIVNTHYRTREQHIEEEEEGENAVHGNA